MRTILLAAILTACSPAVPEASPPGSRPVESDTAGHTDTAEDIGSSDACVVEQVEDADFANDFGQQLEVALDTWACGYVDVVGDNDYLTFTTPSAGWVEILVEAESRGSPADAGLVVSFLENGDGIATDDRPGSLDPWSVFYAETAGTYIVDIVEVTGAFGPEYAWWFKAAMTTVPVEYDVEDVAEHSSLATVENLPADTTYFAGIAANGESDWWHVDVPEGANWMTVTTEAADFGSAVDLTLELYWADADSTFIVVDGLDRDGEGDDPWCELELSEVMQSDDMTGINIRAYNWFELEGSMFHWYTITVTFD